MAISNETRAPGGRRADVGAQGERIAADHLRRAGYAVLERNARCGRTGELDLVAVDGDCIVFCEVKTRTATTAGGPSRPLDAVGPRKRRRLRRLAAIWLHTRAHPPAPTLRFDAVGVTLDARGELVALDHVESAF